MLKLVIFFAYIVEINLYNLDKILAYLTVKLHLGPYYFSLFKITPIAILNSNCFIYECLTPYYFGFLIYPLAFD